MDLQDSLRRACNDESAFRELYDWTIDRVYPFALYRLANKDLALDVCQNIYLALWQALPKFKYISDTHFYAFLFKIARRQISKIGHSKIVSLNFNDNFEVPAPSVQWEDYRVLLDQVQALNAKERVCVQLRYFQDWKFMDIALALKITENHAKVIHHRALKKLHQALGTNIYA